MGRSFDGHSLILIEQKAEADSNQPHSTHRSLGLNSNTLHSPYCPTLMVSRNSIARNSTPPVNSRIARKTICSPTRHTTLIKTHRLKSYSLKMGSGESKTPDPTEKQALEGLANDSSGSRQTVVNFLNHLTISSWTLVSLVGVISALGLLCLWRIRRDLIHLIGSWLSSRIDDNPSSRYTRIPTRTHPTGIASPAETRLYRPLRNPAFASSQDMEMMEPYHWTSANTLTNSQNFGNSSPFHPQELYPPGHLIRQQRGPPYALERNPQVLPRTTSDGRSTAMDNDFLRALTMRTTAGESSAPGAGIEEIESTNSDIANDNTTTKKVTFRDANALTKPPSLQN